MSNAIRTPEYDAFGPWVMRVNSTAEVPPLFREAVDLSDARLVLKIPRPIERRNANPFMDLYDQMLLVRENHLEILTRAPNAPKGWNRYRVAWDELLAVSESTDLLAGLLQLHLASGEVVEIRFNAVSEELIIDLLATIPGLFPTADTSKQAKDMTLFNQLRRGALDEADVAVINRFLTLQRQYPNLHPLAVRRRKTVTRNGRLAAKALDRLYPAHLNAAVVCTIGNNLFVMHRKRSGLEHLRVPELSLAFTLVPLHAVRLEISDLPRWNQVRQLQLTPTSITFHTTTGDGLENALVSLLDSQGNADVRDHYSEIHSASQPDLSGFR